MVPTSKMTHAAKLTTININEQQRNKLAKRKGRSSGRHSGGAGDMEQDINEQLTVKVTPVSATFFYLVPIC